MKKRCIKSSYRKTQSKCDFSFHEMCCILRANKNDAFQLCSKENNNFTASSLITSSIIMNEEIPGGR